MWGNVLKSYDLISESSRKPKLNGEDSKDEERTNRNDLYSKNEVLWYPRTARRSSRKPKLTGEDSKNEVLWYPRRARRSSKQQKCDCNGSATKWTRKTRTMVGEEQNFDLSLTLSLCRPYDALSPPRMGSLSAISRVSGSKPRSVGSYGRLDLGGIWTAGGVGRLRRHGVSKEKRERKEEGEHGMGKEGHLF